MDSLISLAWSVQIFFGATALSFPNFKSIESVL